MQKFILFFLFLLFTTGSALAQQTYVWEQYGLAIDVPDDFKVTKNTDTEFELSGDQMAMYMYLFEQDISVEAPYPKDFTTLLKLLDKFDA